MGRKHKNIKGDGPPGANSQLWTLAVHPQRPEIPDLPMKDNERGVIGRSVCKRGASPNNIPTGDWTVSYGKWDPVGCERWGHHVFSIATWNKNLWIIYTLINQVDGSGCADLHYKWTNPAHSTSNWGYSLFTSSISRVSNMMPKSVSRISIR